MKLQLRDRLSSINKISYSIVVCTLDNTSGLKRFLKTLLRQKQYPEDLIVVHGRPHGDIRDEILSCISGSGIRLVYVNCPPGLVYQRNVGLKLCKSDVVIYFDDDVLLENEYIEELLEVYAQNPDVVGAQGLITNEKHGFRFSAAFKKLFGIYTGIGGGGMHRSIDPVGQLSFPPSSDKFETKYLSGCNMSYRMSAVKDEEFDQNMHPYWWMDDVEFSFRASKKGRMYQVNNSRLVHEGNSVNRKSFRRVWRMKIVNQFYFFKKHGSAKHLPFLYWAFFGNFFVAAFQVFKGYGLDGLKGLMEGIGEIAGIPNLQHSRGEWDKNNVRISCADTREVQSETAPKNDLIPA